MKKILTFMTAAALLFTLAACGNKESETQAPSSSTTQSTSPTTQTTAPSSQSTAPENTTAPTDAEEKFEEIVLVDNEDVTIKITGVEHDSIWGYSLKVFLENKTDLELMFTVQNVSVNGFMCDPFWAMSVDAGKKSNTTISWLDSALEENGIEKVEEITFTLRAYNNADWLAEDVFNQTFTVNP